MTNRIVELYQKINNELEDINSKIAHAEAGIVNIKAAGFADIPARIEHLEEVLEKIDEYVLKVKGFQELAKKNLESQNVLTIEAPPGYRVNLNRLKNWSMLIDPQSDNDPYAQRVLAVAKCDECFLEQKRTEFTQLIKDLKNDQITGFSEEMSTLEDEIRKLEKKRNEIAAKDEVRELSELLSNHHRKFQFQDSLKVYTEPEEKIDTIAIGSYGVSFDFGEDNSTIKNQFGEFYSEEDGLLLIPMVLDASDEMIIKVSCAPSKNKQLDKALQNIVMNNIEGCPAGMRKIYVLDGVRFNSNSMGSIRKLENTFALESIPRNPERLTATLEEIVSSFADMDDILESYDSVREYNEIFSDAQLTRSLIILFGWPGAYSEHDREMIRRILINYERYGISCVIISYDDGSKRVSAAQSELTEYAMQNAIDVRMTSRGTTIKIQEEMKKFVWYSMSNELSDEYADSIRSIKLEKNLQGNEYTKRYSLSERPSYTREYKKLELPVGIDGKDEAHSIAFENENFATYLVGASRSGKSTLLHTLIAGLIRNYHPDNVELWLADFKQLEFKRYMKHLPPHVKYILLDESPELVFDLIDKLTDEMMKRQRLFSRLGKQRIDQINPKDLDEPLPVIFIILDEFSIMSQSISESPVYKLRLQNLLAKGAALGMKFLFSSQTFTTGVAGLTATARAQIQQRIAMKGTNEEISETLELSANLKTDQVRNWMEALPPHYALIKYRLGADTLPQVKRLLVMYFEDYAPRDKMIDDIRKTMYSVESYTPEDLNSYVDKRPVLVDGNSYNQFSQEALLEYKRQQTYASDDLIVSFGVPRLMTPIKPAVISPETRENVLLIARAAEHACAASIIMSNIKSLKAQNARIQVWAYNRHPLFNEYKSVIEKEGVEIFEGIDSICDEIRRTKNKILNKEYENKLVVLIGMDRICMDFEFVDNGGTRKTESDRLSQFDKAELKGEEAYKQEYAQKWMIYRRQFKREAQKKASSKEELKAMIMEEEKRFHEEYFKEKPEYEETTPINSNEVIPAETSSAENAEKVVDSGAYDASDDFVYVMKQGSRNGIHFLMFLNSVADLKATKIKADLFRHKLLFQISADDSRSLIGNKAASLTPEHICLYDDTLTQFSFRPYIHRGVGWEGWYVNESNELISPFVENDE